MDRITSKQLFESNRRVTRYQVNAIKNVFPFLALPPELRNVIYAFTIDTTTLKRFFDIEFEEFMSLEKKTKSCRKQCACQKSAQSIFLVNKQIFLEASYVLQKQSITFHHGLLKHDLEDVISASVLCKVSSIEVTDAGHGMTTQWGRTVSWYGYMRLLKQLGELLSTGEHKLKKLTVDFTSPALVEHVTVCHQSGWTRCGFRDTMTQAIAGLSRARGIEEVTLRGINAEEAATAKKVMEEAPVFNFLSLPREIRNMVYEQAADWSDISKKLHEAFAQWTNKFEKFPFPPRSTPTVLLINKQISAEAAAVLAKKPLHITLPADDTFNNENYKIPSVLGFISHRTLKHVTTIHIDMQDWFWIFSLESRFIDILVKSKNLKHLKFTFGDQKKGEFLASPGQAYPDNCIASKLKILTTIRGLKTVAFEGDLPLTYTTPLAAIMTSASDVLLQNLPKPMAITSEAQVVEVDDVDRP